MPLKDEDSWERYQMLIKSKLAEIEDLKKELSEAKTQIAILQLKASLWGFAAGALPIIAYILYEAVKK